MNRNRKTINITAVRLAKLMAEYSGEEFNFRDKETRFFVKLLPDIMSEDSMIKSIAIIEDNIKRMKSNM